MHKYQENIEELYRLGLAYLWHEQAILSSDVHLPVICQRIIGHCVQSLFADICVSKNVLFANIWLIIFAFNFTSVSLYLLCKKQICKIRLS